MTMTAKYAGVCRKCQGRFDAGVQINWTKGDGATHIACGPATATATATAPRKPVRRSNRGNYCSGCRNNPLPSGLCARCDFDEFDN